MQEILRQKYIGLMVLKEAVFFYRMESMYKDCLSQIGFLVLIVRKLKTLFLRSACLL
jgi:hypothetical protein